MSFATFKQTCHMAEMLEDKMLLVSGGEPTDHPELVKFLTYAKGEGMHLMLLTNGEWLVDPAFSDKEAVLRLVDGVQVTNDDRYYPRRVAQVAHPKVVYETRIRRVVPFGRAKTNGLETQAKGPLCFNLRSFARAYSSLRMAIKLQRVRGSFCTPSVNIDGSVLAGEAVTCCSIGHVSAEEPALDKGIINLQCNNCGLCDGLSTVQKEAIGEPISPFHKSNLEG